MPEQPKPSIMHSLGAFFGHVIKGVKTDPAAPKPPVATRTKVEEEVRDTPQGKVVLRRTTIEEIELRPDQAHADQTRSDQAQPDQSRPPR